MLEMASTKPSTVVILDHVLFENLRRLERAISEVSLTRSPATNIALVDLKEYGQLALPSQDSKIWNELIDGAQASTDGFINSDRLVILNLACVELKHGKY